MPRNYTLISVIEASKEISEYEKKVARKIAGATCVSKLRNEKTDRSNMCILQGRPASTCMHVYVRFFFVLHAAKTAGEQRNDTHIHTDRDAEKRKGKEKKSSGAELQTKL